MSRQTTQVSSSLSSRDQFARKNLWFAYHHSPALLSSSSSFNIFYIYIIYIKRRDLFLQVGVFCLMVIICMIVKAEVSRVVVLCVFLLCSHLPQLHRWPSLLQINKIFLNVFPLPFLTLVYPTVFI